MNKLGFNCYRNCCVHVVADGIVADVAYDVVVAVENFVFVVVVVDAAIVTGRNCWPVVPMHESARKLL